ncbi:endo alpha-1,4 polygalactosaminidase [Micromonospora zhanjiangensis]
MVPALGTVALLLCAAGCAAFRDRPAPPRPWTVPAPTWQWQLTGALDTSVDADVFLLDPVTTTADDAQLLHSRQRRLICYVEAGAVRRTDPDATRFPAAAVGGPVGPPTPPAAGVTVAPPGGTGGVGPATPAFTPTGTPLSSRPADPDRATGGDARWLDVRRWDVLEPVLTDRLRLCRGKGFDGVAFGRVDGWAYRTGFPLTFDDGLAFNRRLAALAHSLSLSAGLVDDLPQVAALQPDFDFAVNQECVRYRQCDRLQPFAGAGKPVLHVEYTGRTAEFCTTSLGYGFASMRKDRTLGVWRQPCLR